MRLPILAGRLRGGWWLLGARGKIMRVVNGTYEPEQTVLFETIIRPGHAVLDVGAHVGYYTLLASKLVGERGRVYAFEPDPRNARYLREHVRLNGRSNVTIEELAVADRSGDAAFRSGNGSGTGMLARDGGLTVGVTSLDAYCEANAIVPDAVKIDVEGGEVEVLSGARRVLEQRPVIFLSTHEPERYAACVELLLARGYHCQTIPGTGAARSAELLCTPGPEGRS